MNQTPETQTAPDSIGIMLAGGQSRRMGGIDKKWLPFNNTTLLEHAINRASPQVEQLLVSCNEDIPNISHTILGDEIEGNIGPAAGIISAFRWAQHHCRNAKWLFCFACDTPLFPSNLTSLLLAQAQRTNCDVVVPVSKGQLHYTFSMWSYDSLIEFEARVMKGERALKKLINSTNYTTCDLSSISNAFFNINTPEDWALLAHIHRP